MDDFLAEATPEDELALIRMEQQGDHDGRAGTGATAAGGDRASVLRDAGADDGQPMPDPPPRLRSRAASARRRQLMHINRPIFRAAGVLVTAVAAVALAAGCGDNPDGGDHTPEHPAASATGSPTAAAEHNQADITFAQGMIPHHQQAVEMAELAESRASDPQVKALAAEIKSAQAPEIQQMTAWLGQWGAAGGAPTAGGHDAHGAGMPGMMTGQDMADLKNASGNEFDRMFLEMMIRHHEGAVQMATTEREQGQDPAAKSLAEKIVADQTAEIGQMRDLLEDR